MTRFGKKFCSILIVISFGVLAGGGESALADDYTFTSFDYPGSHITIGKGINNGGQVVGIAAEAPPGAIDSGFLYDKGSFSLIRFPDATATYANGISNDGLIVGQYHLSGQNFTGFLDDHGTYTTISVPGSTTSSAGGVNNSGQIVGGYSDSLGSHGFLFNGTTYAPIDVPGASSTSALGINDSGQILVSYSLGGQMYWAIDDGGTFSTIALPSSSYTVTGFNSLDQIVGTVNGNFLGSHGSFGFVDDHGVFHIFAVPESVSIEGTTTLANGINDFGEVTGDWQAQSSTNESGYVATPVPEPGTLGLAGTGLIFLAEACRRRFSSRV